MTAAEHLPTKETQHSDKNTEYLWCGGIGGASSPCGYGYVCSRLQRNDWIFSILEDKSLGSTRINSEFKVKINAVDQQSFFKILSRFPRVQGPILSEGQSLNTDPLLGESLPRSLSYCSMH